MTQSEREFAIRRGEEHVPDLPIGYSVVAIPTFGPLASVEDVLDTMNAFYGRLNAQGAERIHQFSQDVRAPGKNETREFLVVKRTPSGQVPIEGQPSGYIDLPSLPRS